VAHKLDVIRDFDVVIVMGDGAVVEIGNPDELLAKPSALRTLWDHQGL
jgi:ABC-type multidrug transport system fused ATPase/permease subunit